MVIPLNPELLLLELGSFFVPEHEPMLEPDLMQVLYEALLDCNCRILVHLQYLFLTPLGWSAQPGLTPFS